MVLVTYRTKHRGRPELGARASALRGDKVRLVTSAKPERYKSLLLAGWALLVFSLLWGLLQIGAIYKSPSEIESDWQDCLGNLGWPNNQAKSNCGTLSESMNYTYGQINEHLLMMALFLVAGAILLVVGHRGKPTAKGRLGR